MVVGIFLSDLGGKHNNLIPVTLVSVTNTCLEDQFWSHFSVPVKSRISRSPYGLRSYVYRFLDQYHEVPLEYVVIVSYPDP